MKNFCTLLSFRILVLAVGLVAPLCAFAYTEANYNALCDFNDNGIFYTINPDRKSVSVCHNATTSGELAQIRNVSSAKTFYSGEVVIPESVEHDGTIYPVKAIGFYAFAGNTGLTGVSLPESVDAIWAGAFAGCSGLTTLNLTDNVEIVSSGAFDKCDALQGLDIPSALTRLDYQSFGPVEFSEITIPSSVSTITGFPDCTKATFGKYDRSDYNNPDFLAVGNGSESPGIVENGGPRLKEIILPEGIFQMNEYSVCVAALRRVVLPPTEGVLAYSPAIAGCPELREFVSMSVIPPRCDMDLVHQAATVTDDSDDRYGWLADYAGVTLIVPEGCEEAYASAPVWRKFTEIRGVKDIGNYILAAVDDVISDSRKDQIEIRPGTGSVNIIAPQGTKAEIYTATGVVIRRTVIINGTANIELAPGLYIVKAGEVMAKTAVR